MKVNSFDSFLLDHRPFYIYVQYRTFFLKFGDHIQIHIISEGKKNIHLVEDVTFFI